MFLYLILVLLLMIPILAIVLDSQVGRALARRLESRSPGSPDELVADRVSYLEGEVERLHEELERLDEESRFLHELLAERHDQPETLPPDEVESLLSGEADDEPEGESER